MVAATTGILTICISTGKCPLRKVPKMLPKIWSRHSHESSTNASREKWRSSRLLMGLRPPPGGAIAPTNWMSCSYTRRGATQLASREDDH
eukprot:1196258-Prorocentrum_minimum.AAC.8